MSVQKLFYTVLILSGLYIVTISAEETVKVYDVPHAKIFYKISGGGVFNRDLNITLDGNITRQFGEWGIVELLDINMIEHTEGVLSYFAYRDFCEKRQKNKAFEVDFKKKKILQRVLPKRKSVQKRTEGLSFTSQQMVANVICNMWEGNGIKKCLYKGIPILREYTLLGMTYREEATDIRFDIDMNDSSKCMIPNYPVKKFELFTGNFKTNEKESPKAFSRRLLKTIEILDAKGIDVAHIPTKLKRRFLNMLGEPIYKEQAALLPKLLDILKRTRACLMLAQDTAKANTCLQDLVRIKASFSLNQDNRIEQWQENREAILETFDTNINTLQRRMKCIRGAKNLDDLSLCMVQ